MQLTKSCASTGLRTRQRCVPMSYTRGRVTHSTKRGLAWPCGDGHASMSSDLAHAHLFWSRLLGIPLPHKSTAFGSRAARVLSHHAAASLVFQLMFRCRHTHFCCTSLLLSPTGTVGGGSRAHVAQRLLRRAFVRQAATRHKKEVAHTPLCTVLPPQ